MTVYAIGATSLTGGATGALDAEYVEANLLTEWPGIHNGDPAFVTVQGDKIYHYIANLTSGATADGINVIVPLWDSDGVAYTGDLRWILTYVYSGITADKTISSGVITVSANERHIHLTGEGDLADTLTGITGGTAMDKITLWRKAGLAYSIVINSDAGLHLQRNRSFTMDADYDNISLVCREADVWVETGGRMSA